MHWLIIWSTLPKIAARGIQLLLRQLPEIVLIIYVVDQSQTLVNTNNRDNQGPMRTAEGYDNKMVSSGKPTVGS